MDEGFLGQAMELAESLARESGNILLRGRDSSRILVHKDRRDVGISAELDVERHIIQGLKQHFPEHGIHSEEQEDLLGNEWMWQVDPLGFSDPASWQNMQDLLPQMDLLTEGLNLTMAFTNEFIPE